MAEAAALLGLRADRARAWLDGYEREGALHAPVIRAESTGEDLVTWGEFVELGYLRECGDGVARRHRSSRPLGRPSVQGVATERLRELFDAGESIEQIAKGYEMPTEEIRAAIAYEEQLRSLAA